jgi:integrase
MASISTTKSGSRRLYYFDADGERRILYLGKIPKKQAESIATHVEAIVGAKAAKTSITLDDATWLGEIGDKLHAKLVNHGLAAERQSASEIAVTKRQRDELGPFLDEYIAKRTDVKQGTRWVYQHTQRNLLACFGADKELLSITSADADDFRLWLMNVENLAEATLRKRCSVARQFFRRAVKAKLIVENPFAEMKNISVGASPEERRFFLEKTDFVKVLNAIPSKEINLRTIFALARWAGMRCPSEPAALKWGHVNWKRGRLTVPSPKTGKRETPIFPELQPFLVAAFRHAESLGQAGASDSIITRGDGSTNWRSALEDAIRRTGMKPWPKLFQNLRSTRETELMKHSRSRSFARGSATALRSLSPTTIK